MLAAGEGLAVLKRIVAADGRRARTHSHTLALTRARTRARARMHGFTHTYTNGPIRGNATGAAGAAFACRSDNPQAVRLLNKVTFPAGRARGWVAHVCLRCTLSSLGRVLQGLEQLNRTNAFDNLCKGPRALSRFIPFLSCA